MALRIRRDDEVIVIGGKDRGKRGRVLRVDPAKQRVYVEGLNVRKRHIKPRSLRDVQRAQEIGGIVESRPLSRTKRWRLVDVLERAK